MSSHLKHVQEVLISGHSIKTWVNEQRVWMFKSLTSFFFASLNAAMEKVGLTKAHFVPTNKVTDNEAAKLYLMGKSDFQAPPLFMVLLCTIYVLNFSSFVIGFGQIVHYGRINEMALQTLLPLFGIALHFPLLEGMVLRKDRGRVSPVVSLISILISSVVLGNAARPCPLV